MFQKIAKHRANDASNDVHRPPLLEGGAPEKILLQSVDKDFRGRKGWNG